jgi:hypothetical protein
VPGDVDYAHEKYTTARIALALGEGTLRERLLVAYTSGPERAAFPGAGVGPSIPADIYERMEGLKATMTAPPAETDEGRLTATVMAMTHDEVVNAAQELIDIAGMLDVAQQQLHHRPE